MICNYGIRPERNPDNRKPDCKIGADGAHLPFDYFFIIGGLLWLFKRETSLLSQILVVKILAIIVLLQIID
jgi:hypothetical protein